MYEKYLVRTETEEIIVNANSKENLKIKVDMIKSFANVLQVLKVIQ